MRVTAARAWFVVSCLASIAAPAAGQAPRDLLARRISPAELAANLIPLARFHPYPTIADRDRWNAVPQITRDVFIKRAEAELAAPWPHIPATITLQFQRVGDRETWGQLQKARRDRVARLVLGEVLENRGRFLDQIANGIWAMSEETSWTATAHYGMQKAGTGLPDITDPVLDLYAGETSALFALTTYLLGDRLDTVSPLIRKRIQYEVDRRVLGPALARDDFWWMGWKNDRGHINNWNPWINSNWLLTALLMEQDSTRRAAAVYKSMRSVDLFINGYPPDGAADEGPSYWNKAGGSLFDVLDLLRQATNGRVDAFREPLVRRMGTYIADMYVSGNSFVNMGDAPGRLTPDAELIYRYGRAVGDSGLMGFGAFVARRRGAHSPPPSRELLRALPALLVNEEIFAAPPLEPLPAHVWLPDLQFMAARAVPGTTTGFYLASMGAHNAQSHNHNDVGNFVISADGRPVLIDIGVATYSATTFGPQRYSLFAMQSAYHNLPTINGVMQGVGAEFRARDVSFTPGVSTERFSLDLAAAYPKEAEVERWARTLTLERDARGPGRVELRERYALRQLKEPIRLNFITPLHASAGEAGQVRFDAGAGAPSIVMTYDASQFIATIEELPLTDPQLRSNWGERLARVVLTGKGRTARGEHRLSLTYGP